MKKKGQITLFIILGILILFAVFAFFYIRSIIIKRAVIEEIPVIVRIPIEFEPIRLFTQECLEKVGTEGLKILGEQGGYIYFEEFGISASSENPTEADALEFAPGSGLYVPYWWYLKAPNDCGGNCLFSSIRPPLYRTIPGDSSIEAQLDRYIETEIKACLNDYNAFKLQGYDITPVGEMKSTTRITSSDVALQLNYPLKVELAEKTFTVSDFYATVPVNLRKIYQFATDITNAQIEYKYLEKQMLDLLNAFTGLDKNRLPPMYVSTFGTEPSLTWLRSTVKERIQEILMIYVPAFQVYNTLNFRNRYVADPVKTAIYQASNLPINLSRESQPYADLAATFSYLGWWPIYFDVNSRGEIIKGQQAINDLAEFFSLGLTRYNTVYDLSYPVVIEIQDPAALKEQGYIFRFALESNFRNNAPIDERFQGLEGVIMFQSSLFCNENQKNSGNVTIKIIDAATNEPIPGVDISFKCGEEGCPIGVTDDDGTLISKFPLCFGGLLILRHPDYFTPTLYLSTDYGEEIELPTIKLNHFIDKEANVLKYMFSRQNNDLIINALALDAADEALIRLTRINDFVGEREHTAAARLFGNQTNATLKLIPGTYEVDIDLFYHEPVIIPEEEREAGFWPFVEEYTMPEIEINDSYVKGGAVLNNETGYLIIPSDKLYEYNTLTFFVVSTEIPERVEEIHDPELTDKLSARFRARLEPKYVS